MIGINQLRCVTPQSRVASLRDSAIPRRSTSSLGNSEAQDALHFKASILR
jgi:hypothetical protein